MNSSSSRDALSKLFNAFAHRDELTHARLLAKLVRRQEPGLTRAILSHPLGDDWMDFCTHSLGVLWQRNAGHLYVMANPVTPQFLKVGKTRLRPEQRLRALNNEAVVGQYICVQSWAVHDRHYLEALAHRSLSDLPRHKEFFACDWRSLCPRVEAIVKHDRQLFEASGFTHFPQEEQ